MLSLSPRATPNYRPFRRCFSAYLQLVLVQADTASNSILDMVPLYDKSNMLQTGGNVWSAFDAGCSRSLPWLSVRCDRTSRRVHLAGPARELSPNRRQWLRQLRWRASLPATFQTKQIRRSAQARHANCCDTFDLSVHAGLVAASSTACHLGRLDCRRAKQPHPPRRRRPRDRSPGHAVRRARIAAPR